MILFKRIYVDFNNDWMEPEHRRWLALTVAPSVMVPLRGLSPEEELPFFEFNAISFLWHKFSLTISYKSLPKLKYRNICWNSFMLWWSNYLIAERAK